MWTPTNREILLGEYTTIAELAALMHVPASRVVGTAFNRLGLLVVATQTLTFDQASTVASALGFKARRRL